MKKQPIIPAFAVLAILLLQACSSTSPTGGTSFVTITIGSDNQKATIQAERATLWARLKHAAGKVKLASAASAAIPSNVRTVTVTAAGSDMTTMSKEIDTAGLSSVVVTLEVPNGLHREFIVTACDAIGNYAYWSRAFADLNGTDISLPMQMINVGSVSRLVFVSMLGSDVTGTGTEARPFRTITHALRAVSPPAAILIEAGTYDDTTGGETFPLTLSPGTAIVGLGANYTTTLKPSLDGIYGADQTYVDNVRMLVCDAIGITDQGTPMHINNVLFDGNVCGGGAGDAIVLAASSTVSNVIIRDPFTSGITINGGSPVITASTIVVTGTQSVFPFYGIRTSTGSPTVTNTTVNGFFGDGVGYGVLLSAGSGTVSGCSLIGNGRGVGIPGGSPTVTNNTIKNGYWGIELSGAAAPPSATITGNTISGNSYGIYASSAGTSSIHSNRLSCNTAVDFYLADTAASGFDISKNAWDHDTTTLVTGPTITSDSAGCPAGEDICYSGVLNLPPTYTPFNAAVSNGCM